jgi:hypothetical protein
MMKVMLGRKCVCGVKKRARACNFGGSFLRGVRLEDRDEGVFGGMDIVNIDLWK